MNTEKSQSIMSAAISEVKTETPLGDPKARAEALKAKLNQSKPLPNGKQSKAKATAKPSTGKPKPEPSEATAKREVVAVQIKPVDEQSPYERRYYLRNFHADEEDTVVRHSSSHTIAKAMEEALAFMRKVCTESKGTKKVFRTGEIIAAIKSYGPGYGDGIRNAMRKADKAGLVKMTEVAEENCRSKYQYELLAVKEPKQPKPAA